VVEVLAPEPTVRNRDKLDITISETTESSSEEAHHHDGWRIGICTPISHYPAQSGAHQVISAYDKFSVGAKVVKSFAPLHWLGGMRRQIPS